MVKFSEIFMNPDMRKIFEFQNSFLTLKLVKSVLLNTADVRNTAVLIKSNIFKKLQFFGEIFLNFHERSRKPFQLQKSFLTLISVKSILLKSPEEGKTAQVVQSKVFKICYFLLKFSEIFMAAVMQKIFEFQKSFVTLKMVKSILLKSHKA